MRQPPNISEAEWQVMRLLWERAPRTAAEIAEALAPATGWKPQTVKTLLARLVRKKAVGHRARDNAYLYRPLVAETDCRRAESRSFLERVFGGALTPMVAQFAENDELSPEQIAELRRILDAADRRRAGDPRRERPDA